MRRQHAASLALLAIAMTAEPASPQVTVADGYAIEVFVNTPKPLCLAIPSGASASGFGAKLYFARTYWVGDDPDKVRRVDLGTRVVEDFFALPSESDPYSLAFGPGAPYSTDLYITSNNRDFGAPGDNGGSIVFLAPDPAALGEQILAIPKPLPTPILLEPVDLIFTPGGVWGTELLVANASDPPFDIERVSPTGVVSSFAIPAPTQSHLRFAFAPGGAWSNDLYVIAVYGNDSNKIFRVNPNGVSSTWLTLPGYQLPFDQTGSLAFDPGSRFGGDLFLFVRLNGRGQVLRVSPSGQVSTFIDGLNGFHYISPNAPITVPDGLAFAPDGSALFIADTDDDVIYRVAPIWTDLGSGLAGVQGIPNLAGSGSLAGGSSNSLALTSAKPSSLAVLFVSFVSTPAPFKGGTLVTVPVALSISLATDGSGALTLPFVWPAGVAAGTSLYFQYAIQDVAGPQGASLSNALKAVTP